MIARFTVDVPHDDLPKIRSAAAVARRADIEMLATKITMNANADLSDEDKAICQLACVGMIFITGTKGREDIPE